MVVSGDSHRRGRLNIQACWLSMDLNTLIFAFILLIPFVLIILGLCFNAIILNQGRSNKMDEWLMVMVWQ